MHWFTICLLLFRAILDGYNAVCNWVMIRNLLLVFDGHIDQSTLCGVFLPFLVAMGIILMFFINNKVGLIIFSLAFLFDAAIGVVNFDGWLRLKPIIGVALYSFAVFVLRKDGKHWWSYKC